MPTAPVNRMNAPDSKPRVRTLRAFSDLSIFMTPSYALVSDRRSPRMPCGRKISTSTSMVKAMTSFS